MHVYFHFIVFVCSWLTQSISIDRERECILCHWALACWWESCVIIRGHTATSYMTVGTGHKHHLCFVNPIWCPFVVFLYLCPFKSKTIPIFVQSLYPATETEKNPYRWHFTLFYRVSDLCLSFVRSFYCLAFRRMHTCIFVTYDCGDCRHTHFDSNVERWMHVHLIWISLTLRIGI